MVAADGRTKNKPSVQIPSHGIGYSTAPWIVCRPHQLQNGTDYRLLQLMQPRQLHSTRSWMPYRPTLILAVWAIGCLGSLRDTPLAVVRHTIAATIGGSAEQPTSQGSWRWSHPLGGNSRAYVGFPDLYPS